MKHVKTSVNGFVLKDITETMEAIIENPKIAKFTFRTNNKWISGGHNRSLIQGFYGGCQEDTSREHPFIFDNSEPPILLGNNEGANPVEFILHGLAGCMTTTMMLHAAAKGISVDSVSSGLEGDIDVRGFLGLNDKVRNGYQEIRIHFTIEGDLTDDQKRELIELAYKSPVYDVVTNGLPVELRLKATV